MIYTSNFFSENKKDYYIDRCDIRTCLFYTYKRGFLMQNYLSPIQAYSPSTPTTPQDKNPSTPTTPSTSKREDAKLKRLRTLLSTIGENGASLKVLMEAMQRKDRKGFVSTYITPNIETGYIAMLYPETPNHPMQSYYLTNKGREALTNL